jgi:hypothetical protein
MSMVVVCMMNNNEYMSNVLRECPIRRRSPLRNYFINNEAGNLFDM